MPSTGAIGKYLVNYADGDLPQPELIDLRWQNVLVVPIYAEDTRFISRLAESARGKPPTLFILVINRPAKETRAGVNDKFRAELAELPRETGADKLDLRRLQDNSSVLVLDLETLRGPLADNRGVGAARKAGCDLALELIDRGRVSSSWICSSDADAWLPADYFSRLPPAKDHVACVYGFAHRDYEANQEDAVVRATSLYELSLHYYVLGLEYAGSPYAFHTLGSCLAVTADAYAKVRGFPKRAGGEDFYLLNKLAKVGNVRKLAGDPIVLQARRSGRVPFGTGPAVDKLLTGGDLTDKAVFYHPRCFEVVRMLLDFLPIFAREMTTLEQVLAPLEPAVYQSAMATLDSLGWEQALAHCHRHAKNDKAFIRHFHQWFDGFRTLKLIQSLSRLAFSRQTLSDTFTLSPLLWPEDNLPAGPAVLQSACHKHWHWSGEQGQA